MILFLVPQNEEERHKYVLGYKAHEYITKYPWLESVDS